MFNGPFSGLCFCFPDLLRFFRALIIARGLGKCMGFEIMNNFTLLTSLLTRENFGKDGISAFRHG